MPTPHEAHDALDQAMAAWAAYGFVHWRSSPRTYSNTAAAVLLSWLVDQQMVELASEVKALADRFTEATHKSAEDATMMELMKWSYAQTQMPAAVQGNPNIVVEITDPSVHHCFRLVLNPQSAPLGDATYGDATAEPARIEVMLHARSLVDLIHKCNVALSDWQKDRTDYLLEILRKAGL